MRSILPCAKNWCRWAFEKGKHMNRLDKFRGCLVGGGAGDALGYAVEFLHEEMIFDRYGPAGIQAYSLMDGAALISDDTQMTLFTAKGLLEHKGENPVHSVNLSYLDWLRTQQSPFTGEDKAFLMDEEKLYSRRAPGNTCLFALERGGMGTPEHAVNDSKGCGGVMRAAPAGLYTERKGASLTDALRLGAGVAALTHGHPLGWLPGAALAGMVHLLVAGERDIPGAAERVLHEMQRCWPDREETAAFAAYLRFALQLAANRKEDLSNIHRLGEGWVGDEALGIAVYCAARYPDDFEKALLAAVNHNGDSDSTGAICGNILGARLGLQGIPEKFLHHLELKDLILHTADRLYQCK